MAILKPFYSFVLYIVDGGEDKNVTSLVISLALILETNWSSDKDKERAVGEIHYSKGCCLNFHRRP